MNYANKTFSVPMGSRAFSDGYAKIDWGKSSSKCCGECRRIPEDFAGTAAEEINVQAPGCAYMGDCSCHEPKNVR
jgi:hypothetical protein